MKNLTFVLLVAILMLNACTHGQNNFIGKGHAQQTENSDDIGIYDSNIDEIIKIASAECWDWNEWVNKDGDGYETPLSAEICNCYVLLFPKYLTEQDKDDLLMWNMYWNTSSNFKLWNDSSAKKRVEYYQTQILGKCKR